MLLGTVADVENANLGSSGGEKVIMFICMYIITAILFISSLFILSLPEIYIVGAIVLLVFLPFIFRKKNTLRRCIPFCNCSPS